MDKKEGLFRVYVSQGAREIRRRTVIKGKKYPACLKCMINSYITLVGKHEAKR
jgi:hypothetical protein